MVALDYPVVLDAGSLQHDLGIKKSKKKKKEHSDKKNLNADSTSIVKINVAKEMPDHIDNPTKKKKYKKKHQDEDIMMSAKNKPAIDIETEKSEPKKDKKKKKHKHDKMIEGKSNGNLNSVQMEEKKRKRKYEESQDNGLSDVTKTTDQEPKKKKDKKLKHAAMLTEESIIKHKKKKNKKSKYEIKAIESVTPSENSNQISENRNLQDVGNCDSVAVKKKKNKKMKDVLENKAKQIEGDYSNDYSGHIQSTEYLDDSSCQFKKDFYSSTYSFTSHNEEKENLAAERYRKEKSILMRGKGKSIGQFHPIRDFSQLGFEQNLMETVKSFKEPTPIQASTWPVIASGRDTIGIAETGSGKTLAFSLPALAHISHRLNKENVKKLPKRQGPMMLVVAPTRELAQQSQDILEVAGKKCGIRSVSVYGGVSKFFQREALGANGSIPYEVVVATPGRLIDLMEEKTCDLSDVSYLVLDEADRMLDQGFERDIRKIIGATHPHRQTCLFSATWPDSVRELAHEFLKNPIKITIGSDDLTAGSTIEQIVEVFDDERQRQWKLLELLKKHKKGGSSDKDSKIKRVLVFVLYKKEATRIEEFLQGKGWNVTSIQGDKSQDARQRAVDNFKAGTIPILVATDVAARGLDIPDVDLVINYSFPLTIEDYVHRIGRTGRAGKKGTSYTFFQANTDKLRAGELVKVLRDAGQIVPEKMLTFDLSIRKKEHKLYGAFGPKTYNNVPMKQPTKIVFGDD